MYPSDVRRNALAALAARWAWLASLAIGTALFAAVRAAVASTGNPNLVPTLILLGAVTAPCATTLFVVTRLAPITVRATAILVTAVVGGEAGLTCAGLIEYRASLSGHLSVVTVAIVEESVKLLPPLLYVLLARRVTIIDGFILAVASSAAFAALETMGYAATLFIAQPHLTELSGVDNLLLWRGLLSPAGHIAWTAMTATALWWAVQRHWRVRAIDNVLSL